MQNSGTRSFRAERIQSRRFQGRCAINPPHPRAASLFVLNYYSMSIRIVPTFRLPGWRGICLGLSRAFLSMSSSAETVEHSGDKIWNNRLTRLFLAHPDALWTNSPLSLANRRHRPPYAC
jgi:hypothetical protein